MGLIIGSIIFFMIIGICIIANIVARKRYIDLLNENAVEKVRDSHYTLLEIKRKRRLRYFSGLSINPYNEYPLEAECTIPRSIIPPEDIIEVYGIEDNNKKFLIYKAEWSKDNIQKIKIIVNKINKVSFNFFEPVRKIV
jgi:hypothetical protein